MYIKAPNAESINFVTVRPYDGTFVITISINNQSIQKSITYDHALTRDMVSMLTDFIIAYLPQGIFLGNAIFRDLKRAIISTIDSALTGGRYSEIFETGRVFASLSVFGINYKVALRSKDGESYSYDFFSRMDGKYISNKTLKGLLDEMIKENDNGL